MLLANKWVRLESNYIGRFKKIFRFLRKRRNENLEHYATIRGNFLKFLKRPDNKMVLVETWQEAYNALPEDLRRDVGAKEEFHARVDELSEALFAEIDGRRTEGEEELEKCRDDEWRDKRLQALVSLFVCMMQCEVDRYWTATRIAIDFFAVLKGGVVEEDPAVAQGNASPSAGMAQCETTIPFIQQMREQADARLGSFGSGAPKATGLSDPKGAKAAGASGKDAKEAKGVPAKGAPAADPKAAKGAAAAGGKAAGKDEGKPAKGGKAVDKAGAEGETPQKGRLGWLV